MSVGTSSASVIYQPLPQSYDKLTLFLAGLEFHDPVFVQPFKNSHYLFETVQRLRDITNISLCSAAGTLYMRINAGGIPTNDVLGCGRYVTVFSGAAAGRELHGQHSALSEL